MLGGSLCQGVLCVRESLCAEGFSVSGRVSVPGDSVLGGSLSQRILCARGVSVPPGLVIPAVTLPRHCGLCFVHRTR